MVRKVRRPEKMNLDSVAVSIENQRRTAWSAAAFVPANLAIAQARRTCATGTVAAECVHSPRVQDACDRWRALRFQQRRRCCEAMAAHCDAWTRRRRIMARIPQLDGLRYAASGRASRRQYSERRPSCLRSANVPNAAHAAVVIESLASNQRPSRRLLSRCCPRGGRLGHREAIDERSGRRAHIARIAALRSQATDSRVRPKCDSLQDGRVDTISPVGRRPSASALRPSLEILALP